MEVEKNCGDHNQNEGFAVGMFDDIRRYPYLGEGKEFFRRFHIPLVSGHIETFEASNK